MNKLQTLNKISPGERVRINSLTTSGSMRRRLLDIGLINNTEVICVGKSPCGGMAAYQIRGAVIALRDEDCESILVC